jgi:hypothetical protein
MAPALFVEFDFEALRRPRFGFSVARIAPRARLASAAAGAGALALERFRQQCFVKEKHYAAFVDKYGKAAGLGCDGLMCYRLRGGVVHRANMAGHPLFGSTHVIFTVPESKSKIHGLTLKHGEEKAAITFDLVHFCTAMVRAAYAWYEDHQNEPKVEANMRNLIRYCENGLSPFIVGQPLVARQLFEAVQQKLTDQWSHRNHAKSKSDHLLTGLLYDDAGHRMIPTHATKAGIRYRYYASLPHLKGESKTVSVGSVSRIPATDIEDIIVKSVNEHLVAQHDQPSSGSAPADDRGVMIAEQVVRIDVHKDRLMVRFKSAGTEEESHSTDGQLLSIPWQKPPSRKSRQILIPLGVPRNEVRPTRIERRARLVNAISRGRRWLDEIVSGSVPNIEQIATRQKCSVRQVNMTISLAFLAPDLVKAAVEGRLPRGIGVERLRDASAEWSRQFETLGLNPQ